MKSPFRKKGLFHVGAQARIRKSAVKTVCGLGSRQGRGTFLFDDCGGFHVRRKDGTVGTKDRLLLSEQAVSAAGADPQFFCQ